MTSEAIIAVVLPCFKVRRHVVDVLARIGPEVSLIYVVDDCCPEKTGEFVAETTQDPRVKVIWNKVNLGVGGAVMAGYRAAIDAGAEVIVKIDGDGQMDPALVPDFVAPILAGEADYTKGNRFYDLEGVSRMPRVRLFGNSILSFLTKFSSGYWNIFDPTNGYTAIHTEVARMLPFEKISCRYFFETDILFRLNIQRAVVVDIPMVARYDDEESSLKISRIVGEFLRKHARNFIKRIFYNYYLRDLSIASIELPVGVLLLVFGVLFGVVHWVESISTGIVTPAGTVMLAALPVLTGLQLILAFISYDVGSVPRRVIHVLRRSVKGKATALRMKHD